MHQDRTAASTPRELVDLIVDGNAERAPAMDTLMSAVNALGRDVAIRSGCGAGDCGACTVLVGGRPRLACLTRCFSATEAPVETTAWLYEHDSQAEVLIELLLESSAPQCGYCTSGLIASVVGWARAFGPPQNRAAAQAALAGVVCRCTGYEPYLQVILRWANHACWGGEVLTLSSPKVRLLVRNGKFRWLFLGVLGSRVGDTFSAVAFSWLALQSFGPAGVGIVLLASSLPLSIAGPIAGIMIERFGAVRCLVVENLVHGALLIVLAGLVLLDAANFLAIIALVVAAAMFSMATEVSQDVLMPAMVGDDDLDDANSLLAVVWDTSALIGPAAAGIVVAVGGVPAALLVDAVSFFLMAVAALGLSGVRGASPGKTQPLSLASASSGFGILWRNRPAGLLSLLSLLLLFTTGAMAAILPSYTEIELSGGAATFGILMSIGGLLSLIGTLGGSNLGRRVATKPLLVSLTMLRSISVVPMMLFGAFPVSATSYGIFNLAEGPIFPLSRSAYQRAVPDEDRARAAGARSVLGVAGFPLGSAAGGTMVVVAGTTGSLVMVAACTVLIAFVLWPLPRDMRSLGDSSSAISLPEPGDGQGETKRD